MQKQQLIILACLLCIIPYITWADLGLPSVHAVCEIRLKDGRVIEGVILAARGGYVRHCDTNGFYYIYEIPEQHPVYAPGKFEIEVLFNTNFYAFQPSKGLTKPG